MRSPTAVRLALVATMVPTSCAPLRAVVADTEGLHTALAPAPPARRQVPGVEAVCTAGSINWIVPVIDGVVLIDAGFDESGAKLRDALHGRPVLAVLLTHAHPDHRAAAHLLNAPVYLGRDDVPLLNGTYHYRAPVAALGAALGTAPRPRTVLPVGDGEVLSIGGRRFTAVALPGHTPGSTGWLTDGLFFTGDAIQAPLGDALYPAPREVTEDMRRAYDSLRKLEHLPVRTMLDAHFGKLDDPKRFLRAAIARGDDEDTLYDHPMLRPAGCAD
jgi:glyoxylase-like metal-dependent hydrolase (beta-lactamase superfamily II)